MEGLRRLRAECTTLLRPIGVPQPFDLDTFCASVAATRQRQLYVHPLPETGEPFAVYGLWVATDQDDHIFHTRAASPLHRVAILLHEVAHILFRHDADAVLNSVMVDELFPSLAPHMVRRVLGRHTYSTREEREAETLAALILERATRETPPVDTTGGLVARLGDDLEHPVRDSVHG